jgi:Rrf2 family protein
MKLSTRARYALALMLDLAKGKSDGRLVSLKQVADHTKKPRRYLEQLAIALKQASLITGTIGRGGGYRLTRPSADITVGEIIEAVIGPISVVDCVLDATWCDESATCERRPLYSIINRRINGVLNEITLADLADEDWHERALAVASGG